MNLFKNRKSIDNVKTINNVIPQISRKNKHPFYQINSYIPFKNKEFELYKAIKEAIPLIDGAIDKIVRLIDGFQIRCTNSVTELKINHFMKNVPVNTCGYGLPFFISQYFEQLLTFGTAVGEIVLNNDNEFVGLYNGNLDNINLYYDSNPMKLKISVRNNDTYKEINNPNLICVTALNPEPDKVYGNSILKGLPFVSNILLTIFNTIQTNWDRVGNVRFAVTYKPNDNVNNNISKEYAIHIANEWSKAMKDSNQIRDFVAVGDVGIKVIGADNQVLNSEIPVRQLMEQIVAKLAIPPFLLGLNWSSTERMSSQQADILTSELEYYRRLLTPIIEKICNTWLRLEGLDDIAAVEWDNINLQDEVELAEARLKNAQALKIELENNLNEKD